MRLCDRYLAGKLGLVALIALMIFVSAVRPLTRPSGRLNRPLGLTRMSLLSEPANDDDTPVPLPVAADAQVLAPPLVGISLLVLKTRRTAFRSVPFRRLKLPPRSTAGSLSSD